VIDLGFSSAIPMALNSYSISAPKRTYFISQFLRLFLSWVPSKVSSPLFKMSMLSLITPYLINFPGQHLANSTKLIEKTLNETNQERIIS
jgi:hypothetical protein